MARSKSKTSSAANVREGDRVPLVTLVTLLCIVSGSLDAISFLALGEAFASVMTGNIVFLGVAIGTSDSRLGLFCGISIIGYIVGALVGSGLAHNWKNTASTLWPARVTAALGLQWIVLVTVSFFWVHIDGDPDRIEQIVCLSACACAMGIQGGAIRMLRVNVSTTYMTGALTTLLEAIVTRRQFGHTELSAISGLVALAFGAFLGSFVLRLMPAAALTVPVCALTLVLTIRLSGHYREAHRKVQSSVDGAAAAVDKR